MRDPARVRAVHPQRDARRRSGCRWSAWAGSRTRCRPSGRWRRATATWWASCAARSPTPEFAAKARAGHAARDPHLPVLQPGVRRPDGPEPVAGLHREPAHRPGVGRPCRRRAARRRRVIVVGGGPGGLQAAATAAAARPSCHAVRARRPRIGGQVAAGGERAEPRRVPRHGRATWRPSASAWASKMQHRRRGRRRVGCAPSRRTPWCWPPARGPQPPWWAGGSSARGRRSRRARRPRRAEPGRWSWSTTSASTRPPASPSCWPTAAARWRSSPPAWSWARTSASPSTWRHSTCGRTPRASGRPPTCVPMGVATASRTARTGGVVLTLLHHPTGESAQRHCDWVVCAVHQAPEDDLWQQLQDAPFEVHPRRRLRHAAAGARGRDRGSPRGGGAMTMPAGIPARGGRRGARRRSCPRGADEAVAEAGGAALVVGVGRAGGGRPAGRGQPGLWHRATSAPAALRRARAGLAPVVADPRSSCCRHRPTAGTSRRDWPSCWVGPCSPAPSGARCDEGERDHGRMTRLETRRRGRRGRRAGRRDAGPGHSRRRAGRGPRRRRALSRSSCGEGGPRGRAAGGAASRSRRRWTSPRPAGSWAAAPGLVDRGAGDDGRRRRFELLADVAAALGRLGRRDPGGDRRRLARATTGRSAPPAWPSTPSCTSRSASPGAAQHAGGLGAPAPCGEREHRPVLPDDGDGRSRGRHRRPAVLAELPTAGAAAHSAVGAAPRRSERAG